VSKIKVLRNGIKNGFREKIENLGHKIPISKLGLKDDSKNLQKNPLKNITSEKINKSIASLYAFFFKCLVKPKNNISNKVETPHNRIKSIVLSIPISKSPKICFETNTYNEEKLENTIIDPKIGKYLGDKNL